MRTTIKQDAQGYVTISYDDDWGDNPRLTRTFFCPVDGGYVREVDKAHRYPQVCDELSSGGPTLMASSREALLGVIRREYKRMRRSEKKWRDR